MLFPSFFAIRTPSSFRPALAINPESLSESLPPQPRGSRACVLPTFIHSVDFLDRTCGSPERAHQSARGPAFHATFSPASPYPLPTQEGCVRNLIQDIRYGIRMLFKQPGFSVAAVVVLSLGIGGSTAMFSIVDALLLKPLLIHKVEQIVGCFS